MTEVVAGIRIPDSRLAREATDLLRVHGSRLLLDHSLRVYLFGAIQGRHRGWMVDQELLYLGAMFHDIGLTPKYRSPNHRFEVDGANAARSFLRANGIDEPTAELVWDAIALHSTGEIPWCKRPEIALLNSGAAVDVIGVGLDEIPIGDRDAVLAAYPRIDFERGIVQAFSEGCAYKPATTFGTMVADVVERTLPGHRRPNFCEMIVANPLGG